jgi:hypothetical protein
MLIKPNEASSGLKGLRHVSIIRNCQTAGFQGSIQNYSSSGDGREAKVAERAASFHIP